MHIKACSLQEAVNCYNLIVADGLPYLCIDPKAAQKAFFDNGCVTLGYFDGDKMLGFCSGRVTDKGCGYITFVGVQREYRRRGIGSSLMRELERVLLGDRQSLTLECYYKNPSWLAWRINGDFHPYAPGVMPEFAGFFERLGYENFATQNAYYRTLSDFKLPDKMTELETGLRREGIEITLYDRERHHGIDALLECLGNDFWSDYVLKNLDKPILVAVDNNKGGRVVAYTGPLRTQNGGRGDYCGIGALGEYRGRGIGKLVFYKMCEYHKAHGASFMSLYTEEDNSARFIYEGAGFTLVRKWKNLRRTVENL